MKLHDGQTLRTGIDLKTLTNIAFDIGSVATSQGDQLLVVMTLTIQPAKGQALETLRLTVKQQQFALLAAAFASQADRLAKKLDPAPGLKH